MDFCFAPFLTLYVNRSIFAETINYFETAWANWMWKER